MKPELLSPDGDADTRLADGLAWHARRWALEMGASAIQAERLRQVARALGLAESAGHACVSLTHLAATLEPPTTPEELACELATSPLVGTVAQPRGQPLVLDGSRRLYLHRLFDQERRLAERLARAMVHPPEPIGRAASQRLRDLFLPPDHLTAPDAQALAVALALRRRLTVISGGPGTGKTTTVMRLLACLLTQDPHCRIALAAPTGKAAARLAEAIRERAATEWPADLPMPAPTDARTVHRWLGVTDEGFIHHAGRPLPIDALVVDEASMMDLALATALLDAVPPQARIVLLGDRDQLAAVEAGAVFAGLATLTGFTSACRDDLATVCGVSSASLDLLPSAAGPAPADTAIAFTRSHRFTGASPIGQLAQAIRQGLPAVARQLLHEDGGEQLHWMTDDTPALPAEAADKARAGYTDYLAAIARPAPDLGSAWTAFARFRVLCAVRDGPRGVDAINSTLSRYARATLAKAGFAPALPPHAIWYVGRPVLVLRNDRTLQLFNGDIGLTLPDGDGRLMVHFPDGNGGWRALAPQRLPPHETAFAMTVHKSQGSEFDEVLVLLPEGTGRAVSRELLYTAVTRARQRVTLCASPGRVAQAVQTPALRDSGLLARLAEANALMRGTP